MRAAPFSFLRAAPPAGEPARAPPRCNAHAARKTAFEKPAAPAARRLLDAQNQRDEASTRRALRPEKDAAHARVDASARSRRGIEQQLQRELRAHGRRIGRQHPAGDRERDPAVAVGTMRDTQLGPGEGFVCEGRRDEQPRRVTAIKFQVSVRGEGADEVKVRRAIDLSIEKYCSVIASLAPDIPITYDLAIA